MPYKDEKGHFTNKENAGGPCHHDSGNGAEKKKYDSRGKSLYDFDKENPGEGSHNNIINALRNSAYDSVDAAMKDAERYNLTDDQKEYVHEYAKHVFGEEFDDDYDEEFNAPQKYVPQTKIEKAVDEYIEQNWDKIDKNKTVGELAYKVSAMIGKPYPQVLDAVGKSIAARNQNNDNFDDDYTGREPGGIKGDLERAGFNDVEVVDDKTLKFTGPNAQADWTIKENENAGFDVYDETGKKVIDDFNANTGNIATAMLQREQNPMKDFDMSDFDVEDARPHENKLHDLNLTDSEVWNMAYQYIGNDKLEKLAEKLDLDSPQDLRTSDMIKYMSDDEIGDMLNYNGYDEDEDWEDESQEEYEARIKPEAEKFKKQLDDAGYKLKENEYGIEKKPELTLEDAVKLADNDVLDQEFGKDTPERKLMGAVKGYNKYLAPEEIGIDYDNPQESVRYYEKKNNVKLSYQPDIGKYKVIPNEENNDNTNDKEQGSTNIGDKIGKVGDRELKLSEIAKKITKYGDSDLQGLMIPILASAYGLSEAEVDKYLTDTYFENHDHNGKLKG